MDFTSCQGVLETVDVAQAVQMLRDGYTQVEVAGRFGVSQSVVSRLWRRFRETQGFTRRPGQVRHRVTTSYEDRYLRILALRGRQRFAKSVQAEFLHATRVRISTQTIRNRLHKAGLRGRRPVIAPILNPHHRRAHLDFARNHVNWNLRQWGTVLFTDES